MFHSTGEIEHKKIIDKKICIGYAKITDYLKFIVLRRNGRRNLHLKNLRFFKLLPYFRKDLFCRKEINVTLDRYTRTLIQIKK